MSGDLQTGAVAAEPVRRAPAPAPADGRPHAAAPARDFRSDIEGLRGIAVLLVVLYHVGVPGLAGGFVGVDVFFVLSGYLITGLLLKELRATGRVGLAQFYARRARRLLPAAALTVCVTLLFARLILSPMEQVDLGEAAIATSLYASNFWFMLRTGDYFDAHAASSPLLHTWSLAVEEQFYLLWPVLVWLGYRRFGGGRRFLYLLGALSAVSFLACVAITWWMPTVAFYASPTRAWQFGLGALAGGVGPALLARTALWRRAAWAGLAAILASAVLYSGETSFPGVAAMLPSLGTALVLIAGASDPGAWLNRRVLDSAPLQFMGRLSYSWYLWHWPFLVLGIALFPGVSLAGRLGLAALSLVAAAVAHSAVENPIRFHPYLSARPRRSLALVAVSIVLGGGLAAVLMAESARRAALPPHRDFAVAAADIASVKDDGCISPADEVVARECTFGSGERVVALFGDSHAAQWFPALERVAGERGWRLVTFLKVGCPPADVDVFNPTQSRDYRECSAWRDAALARMAALRPAAVVMSSFHEHVSNPARNDWAAPMDTWTAGTRRTLTRLSEQGTVPILIRDTPTPAANVPFCLSRSLQPLGGAIQCDTPRGEALQDQVFAAEQRAAEGVPGARVLDLTGLFCTEGACPARIGGRVVYRDGDHITAAFSRSLAPELARALDGGATE